MTHICVITYLQSVIISIWFAAHCVGQVPMALGYEVCVASTIACVNNLTWCIYCFERSAILAISRSSLIMIRSIVDSRV